MQENKIEKLVMMYIEGLSYDFSGIKVTIKSLREYYKGRISVVYNNIDSRLINYLKSENVELTHANIFGKVYKTSPFNNKVIYNYLYIRKFIDSLSNYKILCCDISDIYFKCDPFDLLNDKMLLTLESKTIGDCPTNKDWIKICYNDDVLHCIKDKKVINAGLIFGTSDQLNDFYGYMIKDMEQIINKIHYPIVEQAIVNKLIYYDKIDVELTSDSINHLAQRVKDDIDNKINHQYKAFPLLKEKLYKLYE